MSHQPSSASAGQIEGYLNAVDLELQHIEFALARLRKCARLLLSAHAPSASDLGPLEQMYEDLERAIRTPAPRDRAQRADRTERAKPQDPARIHKQQQQDARPARPPVALLPSRIHTPTDLPLQIVKTPPRSGATSSAGR